MKYLKFVVAVIMAFVLTSCTSFSKNNKRGEEFYLNFITLIENGNKEEMKKSFAPNVITTIEDIDSKLDLICEEYKGTFKKTNGTIVHGGDKKQTGTKISDTIRLDCEFSTTETNYSLYIIWCAQDDFDNNNVGIWKLYFEDLTGKDGPTQSIGQENGIFVC